MLSGHPWIFSGAVERIEGDVESVGIADVFDGRKNWLARGFYNPKSQIRVRLLTWQKEDIDGDFFARRIRHALAMRQVIYPARRTPTASSTARAIFCRD